ncbi:phosphoesterase family-domain-containing protein [Tuber borchii]|uniref:Phosphoesterase family-domain-containing protein n=1 Tax=Tuber borchii TaxID=42251 RepID=A0A2T7A2Y4_TUBBO|nr:phosphoesterase family-domain-containing protein [Tuber borchii]
MRPLGLGLLAAVAALTVSASDVKGKVFNRFVTIWLENTDYDKAAGDRILLSNYFALTHPSEPNYVASVGGEYFGINNDDLNKLPANISSVADLLEDKGISWGEYQEDMPYTGFTGFDYPNQETKANAYVRKHNPLVMYNSVADVPERLSKIKNLTLFSSDLEAKNLPQWIFITPNMTSDGHDTSVTVAGTWTRSFLEPLLTNDYFMKDTLILITFDENHTYTSPNRVVGILLGGAVPESAHGTTDSNYYDHYSEISTIEANWDLHTLGRYDVGANVFSLVADKTKDVIRSHPNLDSVYLNESYPGIFHSKNWAPQPVPNTSLTINGRSVLPGVVKAWGSDGNQKQTVYGGDLEIPSAANPPKYP